MEKEFCSPILFLVFNRPETTIRVFKAIRQVRPPRLFVAADGPRSDRPGEAEKCAEVRKIATAVDWPCEVKTLFREQNLGCRVAVSSAVNWFFENVEEGIILEDDCLPHPDFFRFCQELLEYYRNDKRIMHIGGNNFQFVQKCNDASYCFSRYAHIWGWASWRRAWKHYDVDLNNLDEAVLTHTFKKRHIIARWLEILMAVKRKDPNFNTWDFQWAYTLFAHDGLAVIPNVNLISNIGFGSGTHIQTQNNFSEIQFAAIDGVLIHPSVIVPDDQIDKITFKKCYQQSLFHRIILLLLCCKAK